jgi:hypothetical protein
LLFVHFDVSWFIWVSDDLTVDFSLLFAHLHISWFIWVSDALTVDFSLLFVILIFLITCGKMGFLTIKYRLFKHSFCFENRPFYFEIYCLMLQKLTLEAKFI